MIQLYQGDCLEVMRTLPDGCVDSVVTDPPYGLKFMGKHWDHGVPSVEVWTEVLRVLKPGGYLLAFGGTRTYHRMVVAIEDGGFEIRDQIGWAFGSGFPKSLDVSKAIDKMGGEASPPAFAAWLRAERKRQGITAKDLCERGKLYKNVNHGGLVSNWEAGLGFPDAAQFNLICDLLKLPFDRREEVKREVLGWRKVAAGVAFSSEGPSEIEVTAPATDAAKQWQGWGTALKPAWEPICVARKPLIGTVAANVLQHGTGALNIDGCRVETDDNLNGGAYVAARQESASPWAASGSLHKTTGQDFVQPVGRWPANLIHDGSDEVLAAFPQAPGQLADESRTAPSGKTSNVYGAMARVGEASQDDPNEGAVGFKMKPGARRLDTGSAARFFYCAKASKKDRGGDNNHPTVKPTDLMRYLCRLVTPTGGVVLDPFMGSGSTGRGAILEGFDFIGIEREGPYFQIAQDRINAAMPVPEWLK